MNFITLKEITTFELKAHYTSGKKLPSAERENMHEFFHRLCNGFRERFYMKKVALNVKVFLSLK
jgi:hypothetical protein